MKKALSLLLALVLCLGLAVPAMAGEDTPVDAAVIAADKLFELGLFKGVGTNEDGTPNYALDRALNRMEAVTMLVRLLGKEAEALTGEWEIPFTDVDAWAVPYVGYAYANGLTAGKSETSFGGRDAVTASQFLTFVLRALGYSSDEDFKWDAAWELTDELGITAGEYDGTAEFLRGNAVLVAVTALDKTLKDSEKTLLEVIEENLAAAPEIPAEGEDGETEEDETETPAEGEESGETETPAEGEGEVA